MKITGFLFFYSWLARFLLLYKGGGRKMKLTNISKTIAIAALGGVLLVSSALAKEPAYPVRSNSALQSIRTSKGVKIAILDSGSNIAYKEGISLIDGTVRDKNGHGTLMAKIIKETYPEAELYIIKVMNESGLAVSERSIVLGLKWAISRGVDIINMSLKLKNSKELYQAIKKAHAQGIIIVAAAGNLNAKNSILTTIHHSPFTIHETAYPANYLEVISVGALNRRGGIYQASAKGAGVDIYCRGYKGKTAGTSIASAYAAGFIAKEISECYGSQPKAIEARIRGKGIIGRLAAKPIILRSN